MTSLKSNTSYKSKAKISNFSKIKILSRFKVLFISSYILLSCNNVDHCDCVDKMSKWKEQGMFVNKTVGDEAVKCRDFYAKVESHPDWEWQKQVEYADKRLDEAIKIASVKCQNKK